MIEDDGFPNVLFNAIRAGSDRGWLSIAGGTWFEQLVRAKQNKNLLAGVMIWLGAGKDKGDGKLSLKNAWYAPRKKNLHLAWSPDSARTVVTNILKIHGELSQSIGGKLQIPRLWR